MRASRGHAGDGSIRISGFSLVENTQLRIGLKMAAGGSKKVKKVRREKIASCMTCPICNKLLREATTVSECLHTFCRKCIYRKLSDEELESCPSCNIDLGGSPLEKLRPDHKLQDMRAKIFPSKRRKVETHVVADSSTLPLKRKERSLSSLVVSSTNEAKQASPTGRKNPVTETASTSVGGGFSIENTSRKQEDPVDEFPDSSITDENVTKRNYIAKQNSSSAKPSKIAVDNKADNNLKPWDTESDLWQPLNCLVEVASRTKSFKSNSQVSDNKSESLHVHDGECQARKIKIKEEKDEIKVDIENGSNDNYVSELLEPKRTRRGRRRKPSASRNSYTPLIDLDSSNAKQQKRSGPVWFSLVAAKDNEGDLTLPQVPATYLRLKDGNVPVSFIHKYLMKKLDLTSEDEVEIKWVGQPVIPTLLVSDLVDQWRRSLSKSKQISATPGSSAKDFLMELTFARKGSSAK